MILFSIIFTPLFVDTSGNPPSGSLDSVHHLTYGISVLSADRSFQNITFRFGSDKLLVSILRDEDKAGVKTEVSNEFLGASLAVFH